MSDSFELWLAQLAYQTPDERIKQLETSPYASQFMIDDQFNNDEFFSIVSLDTSQDPALYNVHRGTKVYEDIGTDILLAANRLHETDRYRSAENASLGAQRKWNTGNVTEVGHSLGGTLAQDLAIAHGNKSVSYNMGTTPLRNYSGIDREKHAHHVIHGDFVSQFDNSTNASVTFKPSVFDRFQNNRLFPMPMSFSEKLYQGFSNHFLQNFVKT